MFSEFGSLKKAISMARNHIFIVSLFSIVAASQNQLLLPINKFLLFLYGLTVCIYVSSGFYGYLSIHEGEKPTLRLFMNIANKYYLEYLKTSFLLGACVMFVLFVPFIAFALLYTVLKINMIGFITTASITLGFIIRLITVYVFPYLFLYDTKNGTSIRYGVRYFVHTIKTKKGEFLSFVLLLLAGETAALIAMVYYRTIYQPLAIIATVIANGSYVIVFLTAAMQLKADTQVQHVTESPGTRTNG